MEISTYSPSCAYHSHEFSCKSFTFGFPHVIQTDQGTNFQSKLFKQVLKILNVRHTVSSMYHPEKQGALERWHQTLKTVLRKYCLETVKSWDKGVSFMLFAAREAVQESLDLVTQSSCLATCPRVRLNAYMINSRCLNLLLSVTY